jgi:hypothetical protein
MFHFAIFCSFVCLQCCILFSQFNAQAVEWDNPSPQNQSHMVQALLEGRVEIFSASLLCEDRNPSVRAGIQRQRESLLAAVTISVSY